MTADEARGRRPVALVTGASAGIGAALAREFVAAGHDVILSARRADRLEALAAELGPAARVLPGDLNDPETPARLHQAAGPVDVLVNNAGLGAMGRFDLVPIARSAGIVQVNVVALTALTGLLLPDMVARGAGRVLNVASIVGFLPGPGMAVYCATKAYVLSFSEALHAELAGTGVSVTCVCPGATRSEFAAVAGMDEARLFRFAMSSEDVAKQAVAGTLAGKRLVVTGFGNRMGAASFRFAPRGMLLAIAKRVMASAT